MRLRGQLVGALTFIFFVSCSAPQVEHEICQKQAAANIGAEDAALWDESRNRMVLAERCQDGYGAALFRADYLFGYNQKLRENCVPRVAKNLGKNDGEDELVKRPGLGKLAMCKKIGAEYSLLKKAYENSFETSFCSLEKAKAKGREQAKKLLPMQRSYLSPYCKNPGKAKTSYKFQYQQMLKSTCTDGNLRKKAKADVLAGSNLYIELKKLKVCQKFVSQNVRGQYERYSKHYKNQLNQEGQLQ